ncbi:hypothetical protein Zmor_021657 [Zophobas morio]|uniref:Reverse transcriptase n=1 Tax=Zophobas morio TaxID=2755281 RepID=A0AA38MB54_9CUCU|nr:hypothetical protein Zmor_021657 [Zophobas morio]
MICAGVFVGFFLDFFHMNICFGHRESSILRRWPNHTRILLSIRSITVSVADIMFLIWTPIPSPPCGIELDLEVLNRRSDLFTFSGPMGESDIDVTVANCGWLERFMFDTWEVKKDWGVSDHNCLLIGVESMRGKFKAKIKKRRGWSLGNVNWETFRSELGREAYMTSPESFARLPGREQLESLYGWISIAGDKKFKRTSCESTKKWQLTCKRERHLDGNERCRFEYQGLLKQYKKAIKETKVLWWGNFVRFVGNTDPWVAVYKLCRSEKNEGLVGVWDGDRKTETWRDTVEVLLREFFPLTFP